MASVEEARRILRALGMPPAQSNPMAGLTLLALCGLTQNDSWSGASRGRRTVTKGIMDHVREHFDRDYAPNTRETFRRQVLHQFVLGGVAGHNPFEPDLPTNSPRSHYAISEAALRVVQSFGTAQWEPNVTAFRLDLSAWLAKYEDSRSRTLVPIQFPDGQEVRLSPGSHNELQKAVIEEFAPRFAPGANVLYLGDTAKKDLHIDQQRLLRVGLALTEHDKLPDIVLHDRTRDRLFLIEAVTSHGPVDRKRLTEFEELLKSCRAKPVCVSVFPDFDEFRKHMRSIAWETEVWLAQEPDHLIHFNGDRFLGPIV